MLVSQITINEIKNYARIPHNDDDVLLSLILASVKAYIKGRTGLDDTALDTKDDMVIAILVLAIEMYENREYTVQNDKVNVLVNSILDMHSINLL